MRCYQLCGSALRGPVVAEESTDEQARTQAALMLRDVGARLWDALGAEAQTGLRTWLVGAVGASVRAG